MQTLAVEKLYFAHPMQTYDTERERKAIRQIKAGYSSYYIQNPSLHPSRDMNFYFAWVKECQALIFMSDENGYIGKGVYSEIDAARMLNLPVYYVDPDVPVITDKYDLGDTNEFDWRQYCTVGVID